MAVPAEVKVYTLLWVNTMLFILKSESMHSTVLEKLKNMICVSIKNIKRLRKTPLWLVLSQHFSNLVIIIDIKLIKMISAEISNSNGKNQVTKKEPHGMVIF